MAGTASKWPPLDRSYPGLPRWCVLYIPGNTLYSHPMEDRRLNVDMLGPEQGTLPGAFRMGYPLPRGSWDEMFGPDGMPRPHAETFFNLLSGLSHEEIGRRWDLGLRLIREN